MYISTSIKKSSSFVLSPVNRVGVFIFISLKDGMGAGAGGGGGVSGEDGGGAGKVGSERSVCMEVVANAMAILCSRSVSCSVCGSCDEIESMSKYSSPGVGSDRCLVRGFPHSLGSLPVLGALKVPLCSVMVGTELG